MIARLRRCLPIVANWRAVLRRSWSLHLNAVAGALLAAAYCWPSGVSFLPEWFGLVPIALLALSLVLRFVAQRGLSLPATDGDDA